VNGLDLRELYLSIVTALGNTNHPWVKETFDYWKKPPRGRTITIYYNI